MYNLTVEGAHTYFGGNGRSLVHNGCDWPLTSHVARRLRERGWTDQQLSEALASNNARIQADGATVYIKQVSHTRYNYLVVGREGIVIGMRNLTREEINALGRNYGWR